MKLIYFNSWVTKAHSHCQYSERYFTNSKVVVKTAKNNAPKLAKIEELKIFFYIKKIGWSKPLKKHDR